MVTASTLEERRGAGEARGATEGVLLGTLEGSDEEGNKAYRQGVSSYSQIRWIGGLSWHSLLSPLATAYYCTLWYLVFILTRHKEHSASSVTISSTKQVT